VIRVSSTRRTASGGKVFCDGGGGAIGLAKAGSN
jgi:hypothetical protein